MRGFFSRLIIAILAAILFPVFAKAREKARTNTCMNNQRQIAVAITMYVQDNEETLFPENKNGSWAGVLKPYNEGSIYDCPTKTGKGNNDNPEYGFNKLLYGSSIGDLTTPTACILLADRVVMKTGGNTNCAINDLNADFDQRHNGGMNLACMDGHVAYEAIKVPSGSFMAAELIKRGYNVFDGAATLLSSSSTVSASSTSTWVRDTAAVKMPVGSYADATHPSPMFKMVYELTGPSSCGPQGDTAVGFHVTQSANDDTTGYYVLHLGINCWNKMIGMGSNKTYADCGNYWTAWSGAIPGIKCNPNGPGAQGSYNAGPSDWTRFEVLVFGDKLVCNVYNPQQSYSLFGTMASTTSGSGQYTTADQGDATNCYVGVYSYGASAHGNNGGPGGALVAQMRNLKIYGWQ
jgi:prepilin-type processing-associated H-X9-DG protein